MDSHKAKIVKNLVETLCLVIDASDTKDMDVAAILNEKDKKSENMDFNPSFGKPSMGSFGADMGANMGAFDDNMETMGSNMDSMGSNMDLNESDKSNSNPFLPKSTSSKEGLDFDGLNMEESKSSTPPKSPLIDAFAPTELPEPNEPVPPEPNEPVPPEPKEPVPPESNESPEPVLPELPEPKKPDSVEFPEPKKPGSAVTPSPLSLGTEPKLKGGRSRRSKRSKKKSRRSGRSRKKISRKGRRSNRKSRRR